jgi:hypothetical protein
MTDKSARATSSGAVPARQDSTGESAWRPRAASLRRHLRSIARPVRGFAAFRIWVRGNEIAIVALAILAGGTSGLVASLMGGATHWLHVTLFGPGAEYGLSAMRNADPRAKLSPQADTVTAEPDGRSAPEVSLDARVRRCRVGTTGNQRQFRRHTGLMVPFGDGHQGYSISKSTPASFLSGECRLAGPGENWCVAGAQSGSLALFCGCRWRYDTHKRGRISRPSGECQRMVKFFGQQEGGKNILRRKR